jgi:hypothetical protein
MEPSEFRNAVVIPDVNDFKATYDDIRAAYHAVASVDALAAHIYAWCKKNNAAAIVKLSDDSAYRQHLAEQDPDFGLLRDIAKAHKHVILDRGNPQVSGAQNVSVKGLGWGEAAWGEGRWGSPPQVVVQTNAGSYRVVEHLVSHALETLDREMQRFGIP